MKRLGWLESSIFGSRTMDKTCGGGAFYSYAEANGLEMLELPLGYKAMSEALQNTNGKRSDIGLLTSLKVAKNQKKKKKKRAHTLLLLLLKTI